MTKNKRLSRAEVSEQSTWDLTDIFANEATFESACTSLSNMADRFVEYEGNVGVNAAALLQMLKDFEAIMIEVNKIGSYAAQQFTTDGSNPENQARYAQASALLTEVGAKLAFMEPELLTLPQENIDQMVQETPELQNYTKYLLDLLKTKPYILSKDVEAVLAGLGEVLHAPMSIYEQSKSADMVFDPIEDEAGNLLPMSETLYEDKYEMSASQTVRRNAYESYQKTFNQYKNTYAAAYKTEVMKQVTLAKMRGYDSVTDMLLEDQDVTAEMYHNQLDVIQKALAPHMRKYAGLLKEAHGLETLRFSDLKAPFDPAYDPDITIEDAEEKLVEALSILGEDYQDMVRTAFRDRWIDYADNVGKQSGAYCSPIQTIHPYILISWTDKMRGLFTMAHELGHAGHFHLASQAQTMLNVEASTYFIEAPSTFNELLLTEHLLKEATDDKMKTWVVSQVLQTYYHNFITHLLEGEFQRRVYHLAENGTPLTATVLCDTKKAVIESFWGDAVEIDEGAGLTWMRQPHYYMGLYPYTYSAGLTVATTMLLKVKAEGDSAIQTWLEILAKGGSLSPRQLTEMAEIDMTKPETIEKAVSYVGELVDKLV